MKNVKKALLSKGVAATIEYTIGCSDFHLFFITRKKKFHHSSLFSKQWEKAYIRSMDETPSGGCCGHGFESRHPVKSWTKHEVCKLGYKNKTKHFFMPKTDFYSLLSFIIWHLLLWCHLSKQTQLAMKSPGCFWCRYTNLCYTVPKRFTYYETCNDQLLKRSFFMYTLAIIIVLFN